MHMGSLILHASILLIYIMLNEECPKLDPKINDMLVKEDGSRNGLFMLYHGSLL